MRHLLRLLIVAAIASPATHALAQKNRAVAGKDIIQQPVCDCCDLGKSSCCKPSCFTEKRSSAPPVMLKAEAAPGVAATSGQCPLPRQPAGLSATLQTQRAAYAEFGAMEECSNAAAALMPHRPAIYDGAIGTDARSAMTTYATACLNKNLLAFGSDLSPAEERTIVEHLAVLVDDGDQVFCHGFRIGAHVITAKHCVEKTGIGFPSTWQVRTMTSTKVYTATEKPLSNISANLTQQPNLDYALLHLQDYAGAADDAKRWLGNAVAGERLILPQSNMYKRYIANVQDASALAGTVTIQNNPVCYARAVTPEGYIFHPCQTEWGTSGAPLLQRDAAGAIRLVGVHDGATGRVPGDLGRCGRVVPNHGVQIPVAELTDALERSN
jgi:V8-like Glu-specific endopeptidase